ncbi:glycoside hydrolase family 2 TIM barrel-domain containing protein [Coraliomargarita algicola]|uniref:Glycoside hydrolase family 2 TIM barrel-domain containing protein n=1 Tax=Coraliomargarita algicola TaxID=3092156 RepID=A0ABZ0RKN4_9BACT|nr:glycoside hydrolase family 2 TIM barrel-domain containing protein [Coraliomargarita sp. J2-16]WPJ95986.1 glycoside hydrolase family 2 TIM barrel-domain containing protein [Coraliomargarita sp. J2-16]
MNSLKIIVGLAVLSLPLVSAAERETIDFNGGWKFARFGAMPDGSQLAEPAGLEKPSADVSAWRILDLPHDWGIEGPFRAELENRTGKLPWAGIGWYRKTFEVEALGKRVFVEFDGAMSNSQVWLNGEYVGEWPYGYASFQFELTPFLQQGENVLAVRLDNKERSSRWYPGGGIYRNVRLVKTAATRVAHWGTFVTTPEVPTTSASVHIQTTLDGAVEGTEVRHEILETGSNGSGTDCTLTVKSPKLWDLQSPNLYTLETTVLQNGEVVDREQTVFGIRTIEFTTDRGFLLNGKTVVMNGVCQHHDLGPLGTAINTRALERQIEILKEMGCNAIRTSHNPPAPEFLELCDRMGILVQVEAFDAWKASKTPNDYSLHFTEWHERDLRAMVRRDRNHPSVVMWSTGNEVREQGNAAGIKISQQLTDIIKSEDITRPVTAGCNNYRAGFNGFEQTVDVFGYNYKAKQNAKYYKQFLQKHPDIPLYGSETASTVSSRGEYFFPFSEDKSKGSGGYFQVSSYDFTAPSWAYRPDVEFEALDRYPKIFGEFVWTGFDYIGEPTPYNKDSTNLLNFTDPKQRARMKAELEKLGGDIPPRSSYFGIVDLCGFPKDRYFLYQARWRPDLPMAHILPHWNWPERVGEVTPVHVYTSGDEAEVFLNGKSLGRKKKGLYEYRLRWDDVLYQPGELKVIAYKNGKPWAEDVMPTAGDAAKLSLSADRSEIAADGRDLSFITVQISDQDGQLVPRSHNEVAFTIEGPGKIVAVGNGNPVSHEPFQASRRKAFNGLCLVVVQSVKGEAGIIRLTASSDGLIGRTVEIKTLKSAN